MSQTGLGVFAGEQIFTFFIRISATVIGCVLGMVAWYIGAGNGFGNPYGVVRIFPLWAWFVSLGSNGLMALLFYPGCVYCEYRIA